MKPATPLLTLKTALNMLDMTNPWNRFRVCRCLGNSEIQILDMTAFECVSESETMYWLRNYVNADSEPDRCVIATDIKLEDVATHTFLHRDDAVPVLVAFFRAQAPGPDWDLGDSITVVVDRHEFTVFADDPDHIVCWVGINDHGTRLIDVHDLRTKSEPKDLEPVPS